MMIFHLLDSKNQLTTGTEDSEECDKKMAAVDTFIQQGFVTFTIDPSPHAQLQVYQHCIKTHRDKHNWMGFFDLDEFLVLRDPCAA